MLSDTGSLTATDRAQRRSSSSVISPAGKGLLAVILSVLFILLLSSLAAIVADINAHQVARLEQRWTSNGVIPDGEQWQQARNYLDKALLLSPGHPDYLQASGRLSSWSFFIDSQHRGSVPFSAAGVGVEYFRRAVHTRPYWPYAWSELVLLKAQLGQFDQEYVDAWQHARKLGANERPVAANLLSAGLGGWRLLDTAGREMVREMFVDSLHSYYKLALDSAVRVQKAGMAPILCAGIDGKTLAPAVAKRCGLSTK